MDRKKLIQLIGSLFIAVIFITSYAAFGLRSNNSQIKSTAVTTIQTLPAQGYATANITGYANGFSIAVSCQNAGNVSGYLNTELTRLETSGSVANYYSATNGFTVLSGNESSYSIYNGLYSGLDNATACTRFSGSAMILLPSKMPFQIQQNGNVILNIPAANRGYSIPVTFTTNMVNSANVYVFALITQNGTIRSMSVSKV